MSERKSKKKAKRSDNLDLRDGIYYSDFYVGDRRIRRTLKTSDYEKAKAAVAVMMERAWKADKLGVSDVTFAQAAAEYITSLDLKSSPPATLEWKRTKARWLVETLGLSMLVRDVTADTAMMVAKKRREEGCAFKVVKRKVSDSTVDKLLAELSVILTFAKEKGWITAKPTIKLNKTDNKRTRWLTHEEAERLKKELPDHLLALVSFSLASGLRKYNASHLRWRNVNLEQRVCWVLSNESKSRKMLAIQLSSEAVEILKGQVGQHETWVFPYEGGPIGNPASGAWLKAVERAGLDDFNWHDLRHTWATWHVQNGTPLGALQILGGWAEYSMVLRYAAFAPNHVASFADNSRAPKGFNDCQ